MSRVRPAGEQHRVTTFELFFDLVYVFAITRVTGYMAHAHSGEGVLQGLLLLWLLWWTWSAYSWLGNQARADEGLTRAAMLAAMAAIFVVALTIPEAWDDAPGGLNGPVVLVAAYFFVRTLHLTVYAFAAAEDRALRHQLAVTTVPMVAGTMLLLGGVLLGERAQTALFAAALAVDWGGTWVTSRTGSWRIHSPVHWSERHGLFVILAIGESIVAVGAGAAELPISTALIAGAVLGIAVSVGLWSLYFDVVSPAAERALSALSGRARVTMAVEAYTYLHFPIVAGVVLAALGVEEVLAHVGETDGLGFFAAAALHGGLVLYLLGHVAFKWRLHRTISVPRLITAAALAALAPLSAQAPPLLALALAVAIVGLLVALEAARYASLRESLRELPVGGSATERV
jgi:low temperature requirement protein LtrA